MDGGKKKIVKKILNIFINVILYFFLAICLFCLIVSVASKKDDAGATEIFGIKMYVVISPSMEKCADTPVDDFEIKSIPVYSMVFVEAAPDAEEDGREAVDEWYAALKVGDVLTFRTDDYGAPQLTITHRITAIEKLASGGYRIELKGDNTGVYGDGTPVESGKTKPLTQVIEDTSDETSPDYVLGKVTGSNRFIGWIVYSLQRPLGLVLVIIIPCAIIILLQIGRIVSAVTEDGRKKAAEKEKKTADELEELKRQLAELQKTQAPPENKDGSDEGKGS